MDQQLDIDSGSLRRDLTAGRGFEELGDQCVALVIDDRVARRLVVGQSGASQARPDQRTVLSEVLGPQVRVSVPEIRHRHGVTQPAKRVVDGHLVDAHVCVRLRPPRRHGVVRICGDPRVLGLTGQVVIDEHDKPVLAWVAGL